MVLTKFIRIGSKAIRLDAITYVEFLDSGRAMVMMAGLPPEKAHLSVDAQEARQLREFFEQDEVTVNPAGKPRSTSDLAGPLQFR